MKGVVDLFFVFQFIRRLTRPFNEWPAYKYGIIDEGGKILRKRRSLTKIEERNAWTKFDVMVLKMKIMLSKIPGGKTKIGTYAAALWLIKEHQSPRGDSFLSEDIIINELQEHMMLAENVVGPTVNVGGGDIAGVGIGDKGEPGYTPKMRAKHKRKKRDLEETFDGNSFYDAYGDIEETLEEGEYQGREVTLNKPMQGDVKKFKVYVKDPETGNVKKVNFGDKNMRIKKSIPARRKSFRARHKCDTPGSKMKARYWSCKAW